MVASLVTGSRTIDKAEARRRASAVVRSSEDVQALLKENEALHAEFDTLRPEVDRQLSVMEQLRDLLFRNFANNNNAVRDLIAERDRIRAARLYQAQKQRAEMTQRENGVGLRARESTSSKAITDLEGRAKRLFGVDVKADQFEVLVLQGRRVSQSELELLGRIAAESESIEDLLKELLKRNKSLLEREVAARQRFEKYAAVTNNLFGKLGPVQQLAARIQGAAETFRSYDRQLKTQTLQLEAGINAMQQIREAVGNIDDTSTANDVAGFLKNVRSIAVATSIGSLFAGQPVLSGVSVAVAAVAQIGAYLVDLFGNDNAGD